MPKRLALFIVLAIALCIPAKSTPIFDYGSTWSYFIGTQEASSPDATAWRLGNFDDSTWLSGPTILGYSTSPGNPSEEAIATFVPTSATTDGNFLSVFCRRKFSITDPSDLGQVSLNVNIDDGFIAWINGVEVGRYNVPDGEPTYLTGAVSAGEATVINVPIANAASLLVSGENTMAIQVFNANNTSSDLIFDAQLQSDLDQTPPAIADMTPPAGSQVQQLKTIEIQFSEDVQGVDASDLLINGKPIATLTTVNPRDYVFDFPAVADGTATFAWAANHGITDTSPAHNPFAGGTWTFTVNSTVPAANLIISEFMADNQHSIKDDDGSHSDWIEIFNAGADTADLNGWFLTDDTNNLAKWKFPSFQLRAGGFMIVWASGKNKTNAAFQLHTNFKLSKDPSYLALIDPRTNVVSAFAPAYPTQTTDVSYGRDAVDSSITGFFNVPTPGSQNSTSGSGFGPEPIFSLPEGVYTNTSLTISITAPAGQIRYTLDGSSPTTASTLYTGPITVSTTETIKARVFQNGLFPGPIVAKVYALVDNTIATFKSKLPVIIISTTGQGILDHPPAGTTRTFASIAAIDTFRGLSSPLGKPDYIGQGGISIRGQTSSGFPKRPYRLELQDAYGFDRNSDWFGLPEGSDWVLNNPYTDKPFLQNFLAQELFEKMGHYAVRRRFVEVFLNTSGGRINYSRDYAGIYIVLEKIKVDKNRVPIAKLTPYDTTEPNISGGYMFKKDKSSAGDIDFYTTGGAGFSGQDLKIHEPNPRDISGDQLTWLNNYVNQMEAALYAADWKTRTGTNHYSYYIDTDSFVDQHWIVEFAKQIDGYRLSNYFSKDRNGKIKMEPIWDYNLSFGNADYNDGSNTSNWYWAICGENDHIWLRRLMCGTTSAGGTTGDPDFLQKIADRWSTLRTNIMNSTNVLKRVDELAGLLNEAAARDFAKWPRLGTYIWPNPSFYVTPTNYAGIITSMKNWINGRYKWIDSQFIVPPRLSLPAGPVPAGIQLAITGNAGTVYYTLDGSDPRLPGGALSPSALTNNGPITLAKTSRLFTRSRNGAKWSGPTVATFTVPATPSLIVSEIMYHPAPPPAGSLYTQEDFEYIELKNTGAIALNLAGYSLVDGVTFTFPTYNLAAGARVLVVANRAAFESRYGTNLPVAGEYVGQLDNGGEHIALLGALKEPILDFTYNDKWQPITDGAGFALILNDESTAPDQLSNPASWRSGSVFNGTPGQADSAAPQFPTIIINEASTRPPGSEVPTIELQNLSASSADIGGWFITDNFDIPKKFRIRSPTVVPAGGFVVFNGNDFRSANALQPFLLDPLGEEIYLFAGDAQTNLTGYVHGFKYGVVHTNETFGRYVTSIGDELFVPQQSATIGATNSGPSVPPVVITEIMYHPTDVPLNGAYWNNTESEYIEIYNRSSSTVQLSDPAHSTNTWKISGGASFTFPAGASLNPGEYALIVNFNPLTNPTLLNSFNQKYTVPLTAKIYGPYDGNLNNSGDTVTLSIPDAPLADGSVPYIKVEQIDFNNQSPWPGGADATDFSLSRIDSAKFGNDPANWVALSPTPAAANTTATSPLILQQPASQIVATAQNVMLTVIASGANLNYQWRREGTNLPNATSATLLLTNAQPAQSGAYSVIVNNTTAATSSDTATVTIGNDYDHDGMDDSWELAHGFNPFDASDAAGDPDNDGITNLQEYIAGTNPRDNSSYLNVDNIESGAAPAVTFAAAPGRSYTIQFTDSLSPANWQKLTDVFGGATGQTAQVPDQQPGAPTRYYRVVTPAQP